jgi:predicted AlkP superfamily pyrophosphatase or phosphodiesterase
VQPVVLLNVVGLTPAQVGADTPRLASLGAVRPLQGVVPAVTCTAQATMLTGLPPSAHGAVGNGWFVRDTGEVRFWIQANAAVAGEKVYEAGKRRNAAFTCAKMFWWFNQGAAVDWSVTPKPHYGSDGSKAFDIESWPADLARSLEAKLGPFPFHSFWGPRAGLPSTDWIARASAEVIARHAPTLTLVYLPHLDYDHQRHGPGNPALLREADAAAGIVIDAAKAKGAAVAAVSEYGIAPVRRPLFPNRVLREKGLLVARPGPFGERLDVFRSRAFAVVDHQVAHVYVKDPADLAPAAEALAGLGELPARSALGLDHARSGELVLVAPADAWFAYDWWTDEGAAPDFARTVDIHRKPGYDPRELFAVPGAGLRVARRLMQKKIGMRYLMDVVPLDASLVKGSHGRPPARPEDGPVWIGPEGPRALADVRDAVLRLVFG